MCLGVAVGSRAKARVGRVGDERVWREDALAMVHGQESGWQESGARKRTGRIK